MYVKISLLFSFFRVHSGTKVVESGRKVIVCINLPEGKRKEERDATIIMIAAAAITTTTNMSGAEGVCAGARASVRQLAQNFKIFKKFVCNPRALAASQEGNT